jgi:hypothetical protein
MIARHDRQVGAGEPRHEDRAPRRRRSHREKGEQQGMRHPLRVNLYQVVRISIIGAGPAGALAAVRLARAGADVAPFDPRTRAKSRAAEVSPAARSPSSRDVLDIAALPLVVVTSADVESPAGAAARDETAHVPLIDRGATVASSLVVLSRSVLDRALVDAAVNSGARLIPEKAVAVMCGRRRMIVRTDRGEYESDHVPRRRWRNQPRSEDAGHALPAPADIDGCRLFRARQSNVGDHSADDLRTGRLRLVVSSSRSPRGWRVRAGDPQDHRATAARADASVARPPRPRGSLAAAIRVADSERGIRRREAVDVRRTGVDAAGRCRGPGGSADARRHFLCVAFRCLGSRGARPYRSTWPATHTPSASGPLFTPSSPVPHS